MLDNFSHCLRASLRVRKDGGKTDMDTSELNTKAALILAAGPLFAEYGLNGTSVRQIASEAGANVASISYHFGNKEKLYAAVLRYVVEKLNGIYLHMGWEQLSAPRRTREGIINFIERSVHEIYHNFCRRENPVWFYNLILREISCPSPAFLEINREIIAPEHRVAREIFAIIKPAARRWEADVWVSMIYGQILFFAATLNSHALFYEWDTPADQEYIDQAAESTVRMALALLQ